MHVILTKLKSTHQNLRTDTIDGMTLELPIEGRIFLMLADPLDKTKDHRKLTTSKVVAVGRRAYNTGKLDYIIFSTENSTYKLEIKDAKEKAED